MVVHYLKLLLVCDKMPKDMFYVMYALRDRYSMDQVSLQNRDKGNRYVYAKKRAKNFSIFKIDKADEMRRRKFARARELSQGLKLQQNPGRNSSTRDRNPRA